MTWGKAYWPIFLIATSLAFLIPEILALVTNAKNTLSGRVPGRRHLVGLSYLVRNVYVAESLGYLGIEIETFT